DEDEAAANQKIARANQLAELEARTSLLRAEGNDESADALQRQIALQQRIDAINQNDLYTQERKKELIEAQTKAAERYEKTLRQAQRTEAMTMQQRLEVMALRSAGLTDEANQYQALIEHQERLKEIEALREISQTERLRLIELSEQILSGELNGSGESGSGGSARFGSAIPLQAGEFAARIGGGANTQEKLAQKGNSLLEKISGQVDRAIEAVRESRGAAYG
ncbi:MAG: hypothetical protein NXI14_15440, partial [bacterium]|nr:hypothetical protein [bacterium]